MHHLPGVFVRANVTPSLLFHSIAYSFLFLFFCFFYIFVFHSFCWLYHFSTITSLIWCNAYSFNAHLEVCVSLSLCVCLRAKLETINPLALYFPVFFLQMKQSLTLKIPWFSFALKMWFWFHFMRYLKFWSTFRLFEYQMRTYKKETWRAQNKSVAPAREFFHINWSNWARHQQNIASKQWKILHREAWTMENKIETVWIFNGFYLFSMWK